MRINQNISALNAWRNLGNTDISLNKSLERLSSGLRINKAADDAAGLAISEKMRAQIRGLNQALSNAQDGISLIQTAEGALGEVHSILQRMRELAVQSANDTLKDQDRTKIQDEMNALVSELDRIASATQFNDQYLLDGAFINKAIHIGSNQGQSLTFSINGMSAATLGLDAIGTGEPSASLLGQSTTKTPEITVDGASYTGADATYLIKVTALATDAVGKISYSIDGGATWSADQDVTSDLITLSGMDITFASADNTIGDLYTIKANAAKSTVVGVDVTSRATADAAITTINDAIDSVSAERSKLGALQNRLEHTIANLGTASENLAAAESRIRDVDMAQQMATFTRDQILTQAGTAMMAQANMKPQVILKLLG